MALDKLIKLLTPLSAEYGTGNSQVDLLIIFACLSLLSMMAVVTFLLTSRGRGPQTVRVITASGEELTGGASELKIYVDDLSREIQIMLDSIRGDAGYIRQEMYLVKRLMEDTKRALRKQQMRNGTFDVTDFGIDSTPINDTSALYSYKEIA